MTFLRAWLQRIGGLFRKPQRDSDLAAELESHLQLHIDDNLRKGMTDDAARRDALLKLGGLEQTKESYRDQRGIPFLESLVSDLRFGARLLAKDRGYTAAAVLTLALGVGANTSIFSVVNGVLLRPLPFRSPDRLTMVYESLPSVGWPKVAVTAADFASFAKSQRSFESLGIFVNSRYDLASDGEPERVQGARVSSSLLPLLGVEPMMGRWFTTEEDMPGRDVVLLSYSLWQRRYGADRSILGRTVFLNRNPYTVIGVMPEGFSFPLPGPIDNNEPADVWVPMTFSQGEISSGNYNYSAIGRLKPGVTLGEANAEANVIAQQIEKTYPPQLIKELNNGKLGIFGVPFHSEVVGAVRTPIVILLIAVGLVLLIGCANVANLLLARGTVRQREIAVRLALGASRWRLIRQALTESLLIALAGGAAGLAIAVWTQRAILAISPETLPRVQEVKLDGTVLLFTIVVSILTAVLFSILPALESSRIEVHESLQESTYGAASGRSRRLQGAFVVTQMTLAVVLLSSAGLLLRSFIHLLKVDLGFRPQRVLTLSIQLPSPAYWKASQARGLYGELLQRVAAIPGVTSVGLSTSLPLAQNNVRTFEVEGRTDLSSTNPPTVMQTWVMGDYFPTMGVAIKRGRNFTPDDRLDTTPVVLISETMARVFWPNEDPLGRRIHWPTNEGPWMTIVGIVSDVKDKSQKADALPHTYTPCSQVPDSNFAVIQSFNMAVLAQTDSGALAVSIRKQLQSLDPQLPISEVQTMERLVDDSLAPEKLSVSLLLAFAGTALFLAAVGIYGVLSYAVTQRTREVGIRLALGAKPGDVLRIVVGQGMRLALLGAALGLGGALVLMSFLRSLLFGVTAWDPITLVGAEGTLLAVALLACYLPARRAARVDPMTALRYE